jgi:hypothetical protein
MRRVVIVHGISLFLILIKPFHPLTHESGRDPEILKNGDKTSLDKPFRNARSALRQFWTSHRSTWNNSLWSRGIQQFCTTTASASMENHSIRPTIATPGGTSFLATQSMQSFSIVNLLYRFGRIFFFQEDPASSGQMPSTKSSLYTVNLSFELPRLLESLENALQSTLFPSPFDCRSLQIISTFLKWLRGGVNSAGADHAKQAVMSVQSCDAERYPSSF